MHGDMNKVKPRDYQTFLDRKSQLAGGNGFTPKALPEFLFDFQRELVTWALERGRSAIFADCGLGKTPMQLVWADEIARKTNKPVLILTPLAVGPQTCREADKFGIEAVHNRDGNFGTAKIVVTNYERLHYFNANDFAGCVCDESGILKNYNGETRKQVTRFMSKLPYRLLCTATAAPNDYIELGNSSEALGELSHSEMLKRFFKYLDDKGQKQEQRQQDRAENIIASSGEYYQKLAYRVAQTIGQWRLKHHAVIPFWRWVASWSRACRMPSDLGFNDNQFVLPELTENDHVIAAHTLPDGMLFNLPAFGLGAERDERRRTLNERCEFAAALVDHKEPSVIWCDMNSEGDLLETIIPDAKQIAGKTSEDRKLELYDAFANGELRCLIIKPKIGAWGMNWQHCNHVVGFATHSYEQYYQRIRRCYRFGQTRAVTVDTIATEGEVRVLANMRQKAVRAEKMFDALVNELNGSVTIERTNEFTKKEIAPQWL